MCSPEMRCAYLRNVGADIQNYKKYIYKVTMNVMILIIIFLKEIMFS